MDWKGQYKRVNVVPFAAGGDKKKTWQIEDSSTLNSRKISHIFLPADFQQPHGVFSCDAGKDADIFT